MTPEDAIRYLDHQAARCRGRDAGEALCLLLPAMMRVLGLERMEDVEAAAFRFGFKRDLEALADEPAQSNGASMKRTGGNVAGRARPVPAAVKIRPVPVPFLGIR